jgi:hypothetical protein
MSKRKLTEAYQGRKQARKEAKKSSQGKNLMKEQRKGGREEYEGT